jgi:hypothetical protein
MRIAEAGMTVKLTVTVSKYKRSRKASMFPAGSFGSAAPTVAESLGGTRCNRSQMTAPRDTAWKKNLQNY